VLSLVDDAILAFPCMALCLESESALFEWLFQGAEIKFSPKLSSESVAVPLEVQVPTPWMGRTLELVPFIPGLRQADCPSNQSRLGPCTARTRTTSAQTATSFSKVLAK
ncbi:hypothetical protein GOODEAATRI_028057, partial [Goodea atripinnis]